MAQVSLSFEGDKDAKPIALVKGGQYNKETLYLNKGESGSGKDKRRPKFQPDVGREYLSKMTSTKHGKSMKAIHEAMARGVPPEHLMGVDMGVRSMYADMLKQGKNAEKVIKLPPDSNFILIPTKEADKREIWYIAGASGSGKSYIAKGLAERYRKQFPERDVFLVSKLAEDETLDSLSPKPVRLNIAKLIEKPLKDLEPLRDCLIIFDDYDAFEGKEAKAIESLMNDIATMGRHTGTTMLCLTHYLSNYKKTRLLLTEATHFVLYPQSTGSHALSYLLKTHLGMERKDIDKLRKNGSRWVCIHKNFPQYVITENSAWILNQPEDISDSE